MTGKPQLYYGMCQGKARQKNKGTPKMNIYLLQLALIQVSFVFSHPFGKRIKEMPHPLSSHTSEFKPTQFSVN